MCRMRSSVSEITKIAVVKRFPQERMRVISVMIAATHDKTETMMMRTSVTLLWYTKGCFIATKGSALIKTKWWNETGKHVNVTLFDISVKVQNMMLPLRRELTLAICRGWRTSPTTRSVVHKQASAMLDLVRSCGLVFTATIPRMFSTMMRGQVLKRARRFSRWTQREHQEKCLQNFEVEGKNQN